MFKPLCICSLVRPKVFRTFSSLVRLQFPGQDYGDPLQLLVSELKPHPSSPHRNTTAFGIFLRDIVSDGNQFRVYRGTMDIPRSPSVIVKMAVNDNGAEAWVSRLEEEARMYCNELKRLQGCVVPKFFGFYTGKREKDFSLDWLRHPRLA
jgi:hypothetical protein